MAQAVRINLDPAGGEREQFRVGEHQYGGRIVRHVELRLPERPELPDLRAEQLTQGSGCLDLLDRVDTEPDPGRLVETDHRRPHLGSEDGRGGVDVALEVVLGLRE